MSNEDMESLSNWVLSQIGRNLTDGQLKLLIAYSKDYKRIESDPNQIHFHLNVCSSIGNVI
jgi:hypothetical protein